MVEIEYPRYGGDNLTGRSALQPLIREKLLNPGIISDEEYQTYRHFVSDLHLRGYIPGETFEESELKEYSEYAEGLLIKAKSVLPDPT